MLLCTSNFPFGLGLRWPTFDLFLEPLFGLKSRPFLTPKAVPNQRENYHCAHTVTGISMTSYMAFAASVTESNGCGECYCAHTVMGSGMTSYMAFAASVTEKNKHQDE